MSNDQDKNGASALTIRTMAPLGASQDLFVRALAPLLADRFGISTTIDNAAGQDGVRAARLAKADPPDGRHLLVTSSSTLSFYPSEGDAGFEEADFERLLGVGRYNFVLIAAAARPWSDLTEAFEAVRAEGRALRYAGTGSPDRLIVTAMAKRAGLAVEFLALNGPALLDAVVTGAADIGLGTGTHQPLLEDSRVRLMAHLHPRAAQGPGATPTPAAYGVEAVLDNFILVSAPKGVGAAERSRLIEQLKAVVETPEIIRLLTKRLLMQPGVIEGPALDQAFAAQKRDFALLRGS